MLVESSYEFDVRTLLRTLWTRKWMVLAATVAIGAVAMTRALLTTPIYAAAVEVAVEPPAGGINSQLFGTTVFSDQEVETQRRLVTSEQVAQRVVERLALPDNPSALRRQVSVSLVEDSRVLVIGVLDADPVRAADIAQAFGEEYLAFRLNDALERLVDGTTALEDRASSIRARLDEIETDLEVADEPDDVTGLTRERNSLLDQLASLQGSLTYLDASESLVRSGGVILANASVPGTPLEPQPVRSTTLGALLGLLLGAALALLMDRLNDRVSGEHALHQTIPDVPLLAQIPWHEEAVDGELVTLRRPAAPASEAYRTLRTQMRFVTGSLGGSIVAFTSAAEAEGKTTVSANHALTSAQAGYSTILVDADLRKPRVHRILGIPNGIGLSHLLTGQASVHEALKQPIERLGVITAGPMPPNPSELLGSEQFARLLEELASLADVIILDAAPVLPVADGYEVACLADATVCVVNAARSRGRAVRAAVSGLRQVEARLAGVVLTEVDPRTAIYGHYYYEYYGPEEPVEFAPLRAPASVPVDGVEASLWDTGAARPTSAGLGAEPRDRS